MNTVEITEKDLRVVAFERRARGRVSTARGKQQPALVLKRQRVEAREARREILSAR